MHLWCRAWLLLALVNCVGCYYSATPEPPRQVLFFNCTGETLLPYPCANLKLFAATPIHFYADPDETPFTRFRLDKVDVINGLAEISAGSVTGGSPFPFLVSQERGENIICAPGFNPVIVATQHSLDDAYQRIQATAKAQGDLDADYRKAEEECAHLGTPGRPVKIPMVPLHAGAPGAKGQRIAINHSMLVFLLSLDDVWGGLKWQNTPKNREGIRLLCETIVAMVDAHAEKWPSYRWTGRESRIIKWCRSIASSR